MSTRKSLRPDFGHKGEKIYFGLRGTKRNGALLGSNLTRNSVVKRDDSHIGLTLYECQPNVTVGMPSNAKKTPNIF
jgi:hypothetical protein